LLLTESIRAFAGSLSQAPIWCFTVDDERNLSGVAKNRLSALNVTFTHFETDLEIPEFPFMRKVFLSAQAESIAQGKTDLLVWLDIDTIVLQEPKEFVLQDSKNLGCRPVHIQLSVHATMNLLTHSGSRYIVTAECLRTGFFR
jgi:hypothetical protein